MYPTGSQALGFGGGGYLISDVRCECFGAGRVGGF